MRWRTLQQIGIVVSAVWVIGVFAWLVIASHVDRSTLVRQQACEMADDLLLRFDGTCPYAELKPEGVAFVLAFFPALLIWLVGYIVFRFTRLNSGSR